MDSNTHAVSAKQLDRVKAALEANWMEAQVVESRADVVPALEKMIPEGASVAAGGSMTLVETGATAHLRGERYTFIDRDEPGVDRAAKMHEAFNADVYLASANAVTEKGEVYLVDGNGNRVAAVAWGPASVILVVGRNKIVKDLAMADWRRATLAAPANAARLGIKTPCAVTGVCSDCKSPARICCSELVLRRQNNAGRIKVLLVNEDLGY